VDPALSVEQAHAIAHEVQYRLHARLPDIQDVTIHVEPAGSVLEKQDLKDVAVQLRQLASGLGIEVHDVWASEVDGQYALEAHLEVDGALALSQAHLFASSLEERAYAEIPRLVELTTHIEPEGERALGTGAVRGGQPADAGLGEQQVIQAVEQVARETLGGGGCSQVQVRQGHEGWNVSASCQLPGEMPLAEAHRVSTRLETQLRESIPGLERVIIHTEPVGESD